MIWGGQPARRLRWWTLCLPVVIFVTGGLVLGALSASAQEVDQARSSRVPKTSSHLARLGAAGALVWIWDLARDDSIGSAGSGSDIADISDYVALGVASGLLLGALLNGDELTLESGVSQENEVNDNINLDVESGGVTFKSKTRVTGNLVAESPHHEFNVASSFEWIDVEGPGDPGNRDTFNKSFQAGFQKRGKRAALNLNASWSIQDAAGAQLEDKFRDQEPPEPPSGPQDEGATGDPAEDGAAAPDDEPLTAETPTTQIENLGNTAVDGDQVTFSVGGGVTSQINHRNTASFGISATDTSFDGDTAGLVDSTTVTTSGTWTFLVSSRTDVSATVTHTAFKPGDGRESRLVQPVGRVNSQLSERLTVSAGVGPVLVHTDETLGAGSENIEVSEGAADVILEFGFEYEFKRTTLTSDASQRVSPSSGGNLQKSRRARLNITHQVNARSRVGLTAAYSDQFTPAAFVESAFARPESNRTLVSISPNYSLLLNRKWDANLNYLFRREDTSAGIAESNSVTVTLSRQLPVDR